MDNRLEKNLAQMLKGGVIMDVVNAEHAKIVAKTLRFSKEVFKKVYST